MSETNKTSLPHLSTSSDIHLTELQIALIQNIYYKYAEVIIEKEFGGGFSGTHILLTMPIRSGGASDARKITKIGPSDELRQEKDNFDKNVKPILPFTGVSVDEYSEQEGMAALNYIYAGGDELGKTISLEDYYRKNHADVIIKTLENLFQVLGTRWYSQGGPHNCILGNEYGYHLPPFNSLEKIVASIFPGIQLDNDTLLLPGIAGEYPNPLTSCKKILNQVLEGRISYVHGDLHPRNVLVDDTGKAWLIDFAKVKQRHNLFDFIKLEAYIRLFSLAAERKDFGLEEYMQFEKALCRNTAAPNNTSLSKAYAIIQAIRKTATAYMRIPSNFNKEYLTPLFLYCLALMKYHPVNGDLPTRLMFITTCSLAVIILKEHEAMKPDSNKNQNPSEEVGSAKTNLPVSENFLNSNIMMSNGDKGKQTNQKVDTSGGAYIQGKVNIQNGDFVGRDKKIDNSTKVGDINNSTGVAIGHDMQVNTIQSTHVDLDHIATAFALILQKVNEMPNGPGKIMAQTAVQELKEEATKGAQVEEKNVSEWFKSLAQIAPDIWEVAIDTFINPIKGLSTVFQKIAKRAKEERQNAKQ
jgi:hypothetical protein